MKVLIADGDTFYRQTLADDLNRQGIRAVTASDGSEAMAMAESEPIGVAVLDRALPEVNGIEVCRLIRQSSPKQLYIILVSRNESGDHPPGDFDAGADEYLPKPADPRDLHVRIKAGMRIVNLEQSLAAEQHKLQELVQIKNKFIGIAAHDLRNPVISIRGFSELLLKDENTLTAEQNDFIATIHSTSNNMLDLLNDLLDLSQIESGKLILKKKQGSLKKLVDERLRLYRLQTENKRITILRDIEEIENFAFDPQRIGQAVDNLISNAIKFSPPGTEIHVALFREETAAVFSIQDQGPGIPPEEQGLLFNEFQRLSVRPTGSESSTGLGLAITKRIVEAHGGTISFESRVGVGTVFSFHLPIV